MSRLAAAAVATMLVVSGCAASPSSSTGTPGGTPVAGTSAAVHPSSGGRAYPWHTRIVATTFWVGEIFDPNAADGSQKLSTYNDNWYAAYGGCDGRKVGKQCRTERRTAANDYFPTAMTPRENPFYLDLPFDDLNDRVGFTTRGRVIPWAADPEYRGRVRDPAASLMKNRWVRVRKGSRVCYGQIEDAGPGQYHDARYVFGSDDPRPVNRRYNRAGMDVSPALNGCLGFAELNGESDLIDWQFVEARDVPAGPWTRRVTTSAVRN